MGYLNKYLNVKQVPIGKPINVYRSEIRKDIYSLEHYCLYLNYSNNDNLPKYLNVYNFMQPSMEDLNIKGYVTKAIDWIKKSLIYVANKIKSIFLKFVSWLHRILTNISNNKLHVNVFNKTMVTILSTIVIRAGYEIIKNANEGRMSTINTNNAKGSFSFIVRGADVETIYDDRTINTLFNITASDNDYFILTAKGVKETLSSIKTYSFKYEFYNDFLYNLDHKVDIRLSDSIVKLKDYLKIIYNTVKEDLENIHLNIDSIIDVNESYETILNRLITNSKLYQLKLDEIPISLNEVIRLKGGDNFGEKFKLIVTDPVDLKYKLSKYRASKNVIIEGDKISFNETLGEYTDLNKNLEEFMNTLESIGNNKLLTMDYARLSDSLYGKISKEQYVTIIKAVQEYSAQLTLIMSSLTSSAVIVGEKIKNLWKYTDYPLIYADNITSKLYPDNVEKAVITLSNNGLLNLLFGSK